ncbi:hypothetical protein XELAEV_18005995mg [Xenopus laevis]|uniref:Uncharacterized protein n=1 Tax=Xenopus laevis TaxID=8355 RepID=A0A974I3Y6_XENLA|nr:hypothetical protein XELAEV_18005995mg [Xenopus laevis]
MKFCDTFTCPNAGVWNNLLCHSGIAGDHCLVFRYAFLATVCQHLYVERVVVGKSLSGRGPVNGRVCSSSSKPMMCISRVIARLSRLGCHHCCKLANCAAK